MRDERDMRDVRLVMRDARDAGRYRLSSLSSPTSLSSRPPVARENLVNLKTDLAMWRAAK